MKVLKKGFTIVEVAIALTVIGVVAVIMIPQLSVAIQKHQSGAVLGRAVEQIELGNQNLIQYVNSRREDGSYADTLEMITVRDTGLDLSPYEAAEPITLAMGVAAPAFWGLSPEEIPYSDVQKLKEFNGNSVTDANTSMIKDSTTKRYRFNKIPASVAIYTDSVAVDNFSDDVTMDTFIHVYIDTNGWDKKPNAYGRDVFLFRVRNDGKLIPCPNDSSGLKYTKQVVKDGFKIKYY